MPLNNPKAGFGQAAEFQVSALPWVTSSTAPASGSPVRFDFPKITRFVTISNRDTTASNTLSIAFTRNGATGSNKFVVNGNTTQTFELRVKTVFIQGESATPAYSLLAGLTNVGSDEMPLLSGTLENGDAGWVGVG